MIILISLALLAVLAWCMMSRGGEQPIAGKRALVVGGTSGLGLEIARLLHRQGNTVTITSRALKRAERIAAMLSAEEGPNVRCTPVQCLALDVLGDLGLGDAYDYIFCVPGFCRAGYLWSLRESDFSSQADLNYLASARILLHFARLRVGSRRPDTRSPPLVFAVISSTAALFSIPGYGSYAPTKAALSMLARTAHPELSSVGIDLRVFNAATMRTPGLVSEETTKPSFTRAIEHTNTSVSARSAAAYFLSNISSRRVVAMDWFTYFVTIRAECECPVDYLLFPAAVLAVCISRCYVSWSFSRQHRVE